MNGAMFPGFNQHIFFSFLIGGSTTSHFCIPDPKGNDTIFDSCTFFWFGLEKKTHPLGVWAAEKLEKHPILGEQKFQFSVFQVLQDTWVLTIYLHTYDDALEVV